MNETVKTVLTNILTMAIPYIKQLITSKVVPALKRKAYERLDDFTSDRIEDLYELLEKINTEQNETKKTAHLEGFKLGLATLKAIAGKITEACAVLENAIGG
ncbi:MAG: hypothetical protein LUB59_00410 [Candidatus Gastranaerophilales bacterium]|nr:hypothetical protein [Candidatus Gastranaerophilales bacterium]